MTLNNEKCLVQELRHQRYYPAVIQQFATGPSLKHDEDEDDDEVNTGNTQLCLPYYALKSHWPRQKPSLYNDVMEFPDLV